MLHNSLPTWRAWARKNNDIVALPFILVAVIIFFALATAGSFLSLGNFDALAAQVPELGLLSLAIMIIMITGGIDLSTISTANLVAVVMAIIMTRLVPAEISVESSAAAALAVILLAVAAGVVLSMILGLVNGVLVAYIGLPAMLATLGTMIFYEGITLAITSGYVVSGVPAMYTDLSSSRLLGIPLPVYVFAIGAVIVAAVLNRTPFGKYLYMIGSSETATKFSAINTRRALAKAYVISGLLSGVAGMIMLSRFNAANARQGTSLQLLSILIVVLGGTDPNGGFGKVSGVVLALLILQIITSGLNLLGMNVFFSYALWGVLLIVVIAYRYFMTRERRSA